MEGEERGAEEVLEVAAAPEVVGVVVELAGALVELGLVAVDVELDGGLAAGDEEQVEEGHPAHGHGHGAAADEHVDEGAPADGRLRGPLPEEVEGAEEAGPGEPG